MSNKLKTEAMGLLSFYVIWKASSIIMGIIFLFAFVWTNSYYDNFDKVCSVLGLIPGIWAYFRTERYYTKKYAKK